jgi:predicted RNase H-like HicB family nuclease/DNA-binding XRE family transcriptional regulator
MYYAAYVSREDRHVLAEFPDCPGCQTFADSEDEIVAAAHEALEGWLEAHLVDGQIPPRPVERSTAPAGKMLARINVRPGLTAALLIRWARQDARLSQKELGARAGVSQQQITKLENPDENPTLETLEKVGKALGLNVHLGFSPLERVSLPELRPARSTTARAADEPRRPAKKRAG